jgi:Ni2+-binding GTPase involved in maturation of urease and hydrogenase
MIKLIFKGSAGTGKTTYLRDLKEKLTKDGVTFFEVNANIATKRFIFHRLKQTGVGVIVIDEATEKLCHKIDKKFPGVEIYAAVEL